MPLTFSDAEKKAYRATLAAKATDDQWAVFINECEARSLRPGTHVIFSLRNSGEWDPDLRQRVTVQKVVMITTINALRLIANRDGKYEGHRPFIYLYGKEDDTFLESKIPLGRRPHAVSVEGFRKDWREPLLTVCRFDAYAQFTDNGAKLTAMWANRSEEQLAKCCEAQMLRTVAPEECGGLYIAEEMGGDLETTQPAATPAPVQLQTPAFTPPASITVPAVNQGRSVESVDLLSVVQGNSPGVALAEPLKPIRLDTTPFIEVARAQAATLGTPAVPAISVAPAPRAVKPGDTWQVPGDGCDPAFGEIKKTVEETGVPKAIIPNDPFPPMDGQASLLGDALKPAATAPKAALPPVSAQPTVPGLPSAAEYKTFTNVRAVKIVNSLTKAGSNNGGSLFQAWLLRAAGAPSLKHITVAKWEELLAKLEAETDPKAVLEILKTKG